MDAIRKINDINRRELEANVPDAASWHADYADLAWIFVGNIHEKIQKKDLLAIFSQYGNPSHIHLATHDGRHKGFAYLKYEDPRSCVLAIDNFSGVLIYGKPLKVDHTRYRGDQEPHAVDYSEAIPKAIEEKQKEGSEVAETEEVLEREKSHQSRFSSPESSGEPRGPVDIPDMDFSDPMANMTGSLLPLKRKH